jgi:DNA topoisomerase-1
MTIIERLQTTGIRRLGTPKRGFRYARAGHGRISPSDRARIDALRIPPAWRDVAIHPSRGGAVQAIGRDAAGRWLYLYHAAQVARRERNKRRKLLEFLQALPRIRRAVARDLAKPGIPRDKVLAGILRVLSTCFLRPGSEVYASENGSYGIATLRRGHVSVRGDLVRMDFPGKSGKRQQRELRDRRLARLVRELLKHRGEVFKFRADDGSLVDVKRKHINAYIKEVAGGSFSAKDFRTWAGTLLAACALARGEWPPEPKERKRRITAAMREVAHHLGNTPAVCRASYVYPAVTRGFEKGQVIREHFDDVAALTNPGHVVEKSERALLRLLRQSA